MSKTNLKGQYFYRDMGDGTSVSVVRKRRPDDDVWALAVVFALPKNRRMTCFLEDSAGVPFVDELTDGLLDYIEDMSEIGIEKSEEEGDEFILQKRKLAKKDKKADKWEDVKTSKEEKVVTTK